MSAETPMSECVGVCLPAIGERVKATIDAAGIVSASKSLNEALVKRSVAEVTVAIGPGFSENRKTDTFIVNDVDASRAAVADAEKTLAKLASAAAEAEADAYRTPQGLKADESRNINRGLAATATLVSLASAAPLTVSVDTALFHEPLAALGFADWSLGLAAVFSAAVGACVFGSAATAIALTKGRAAGVAGVVLVVADLAIGVSAGLLRMQATGEKDSLLPAMVLQLGITLAGSCALAMLGRRLSRQYAAAEHHMTKLLFAFGARRLMERAAERLAVLKAADVENFNRLRNLEDSERYGQAIVSLAGATAECAVIEHTAARLDSLVRNPDSLTLAERTELANNHRTNGLKEVDDEQ